MTYRIVKDTDGTWMIRSATGIVEDDFTSKSAARAWMRENYDWIED